MKKIVTILVLAGLVIETFAGALPGRKPKEDTGEVIVQSNTSNQHNRQYRDDQKEMKKQYWNEQREYSRQYKHDLREMMKQYK